MLKSIKKLKKRPRIIIILTAIFLLFNTMIIYANPSYERYERLHPFIIRQNFISDISRTIIWGSIRFLSTIVEMVEEAVFSLLTLSNPFFNSEILMDLIAYVNAAVWLVTPLIVAWIGYKTLYKGAEGVDYFKKAVRNIVLTGLIIVGTGFLINSAQSLLSAGVNYVTATEQGMSLTDGLVRDSIIDINHAVGFGEMFDPSSLSHRNNLNTFELLHFSYREVADREVFTHAMRVTPTGFVPEELSDGRITLVGEIDFLVGHTYRFVIIDPFFIIVQLVIITIALVFSGVKFTRLGFETGFKRLILGFVGVFNMHDGTKTKTLLSDLGNTFVVIFFVVLVLVMYIRFVLWLNGQSFDIVPRLFWLIGGSLGLIDGPKIVEKLTGQDAGISADSLRAMQAMTVMGSHAVRSVKNVAGGAKNFAGGINEGINGEDYENGNQQERNQQEGSQNQTQALADMKAKMGAAFYDKPTSNQLAAASRVGANVSSGMSKSEVSLALENTGKMDKSFWSGENRNQAFEADENQKVENDENGNQAFETDENQKVENGENEKNKEVINPKVQKKQFGNPNSLAYKVGKVIADLAPAPTGEEVNEWLGAWNPSDEKEEATDLSKKTDSDKKQMNKENKEEEPLSFSTSPEGLGENLGNESERWAQDLTEIHEEFRTDAQTKWSEEQNRETIENQGNESQRWASNSMEKREEFRTDAQTKWSEEQNRETIENQGNESQRWAQDLMQKEEESIIENHSKWNEKQRRQ